VDEEAARRHLQAAVDEAVWAYAQTVSGHARSEIEAGWPPLAARQLHLARLTAIRLLPGVAEPIERAIARAALAEGVTYAALGGAAGMSRQSATRRYGPGSAPAPEREAIPAMPVE
jgi:hypothetical protein